MKTPVILRIFKNGQLSEVKQFDSSQIIIGHEADVQVDLDDPAVSPVHCLIELRDSGYYICDLGSTAGTKKNGKAVLDEALNSGDAIEIGSYSIQFFVGVPKPKAPPVVAAGPATTEEPKNEKAVMPVGAPPVAPAAPPEQKAKINVPKAPAAPKLPDQMNTSSKKKSAHAGQGNWSNFSTFAPESEIQDLREYLKPTKGPTLEVIVAWQERIVDTKHYTSQTMINAGPSHKNEIFIPATMLGTTVPLVNLSGGTCYVFAADNVTVENITTNQRFTLDDLQKTGKASRSGSGYSIRMEQGDLICLGFGDGALQIYLRFVPATAAPVVASLLDLSSSELTGMIVSVVLVSLIALYMAVYTPPDKEEEKPEEPRLAEFVYNKPKPTPEPPPMVPKETATPAPVVAKATPTPTPVKIKVSEDKQNQKAGKPNTTAAASQRASGQAEEVRPNPNAKTNRKVFTSTVSQGAALKTGAKDSANAQSKDPNSTGLLSAFGGGGNRAKLDKAYSGAGDLLGTASKATGTSGMDHGGQGDDIGSKFKDAGAGGKGTATQGIAGIGTKGRASGGTGYGGVGMGGKGSVNIDAGGSDADFVGTIDREAVRRVIRSILTQIKSCYERQLQSNSGLEGKLIIQFEIEEQGRVRVAKTKSSTLDNATVGSCVAARIKEQRFPEPPPGTVAVVDYPFVFGSQK